MLQVAGRRIGHSLRIANISLHQEGIHHRAYLSIGVTSSSGVGLCGMSEGMISWGSGVGLCRILHVNYPRIASLPLCESFRHVSWMTPKGAEDGLRMPRHWRWL